MERRAMIGVPSRLRKNNLGAGGVDFYIENLAAGKNVAQLWMRCRRCEEEEEATTTRTQKFSAPGTRLAARGVNPVDLRIGDAAVEAALGFPGAGQQFAKFPQGA